MSLVDYFICYMLFGCNRDVKYNVLTVALVIIQVFLFVAIWLFTIHGGFM